MECLLLLISALRPGRVATPTSKISLRRCAPEDTLTSKTRDFLTLGPPCTPLTRQAVKKRLVATGATCS